MQRKYVFIAGANKSGTTSVFDNLSEHPEICPSKIKQTNYFLDEDYGEDKMRSIYPFSDNINVFNQFFNDQGEKIYLEASPDYMYSKGTPQKIKSVIGDHPFKIIFILREPIDRLKSWFNFSKQLGKLEEGKTQDDYFNDLLKQKENGFLSTGNYINYLKEYWKVFGKENVSILFFEDLKNTPNNFYKELCNEIDVDENFFNAFEFKHSNKSIKVKSKLINGIYIKVRKLVIGNLLKIKGGEKYVKVLKEKLLPYYKKMNTQKIETKAAPENKVINQLIEYYKPFVQELFESTNKKNPWGYYQ